MCAYKTWCQSTRGLVHAPDIASVSRSHQRPYLLPLIHLKHVHMHVLIIAWNVLHRDKNKKPEIRATAHWTRVPVCNFAASLAELWPLGYTLGRSKAFRKQRIIRCFFVSSTNVPIRWSLTNQGRRVHMTRIFARVVRALIYEWKHKRNPY